MSIAELGGLPPPLDRVQLGNVVDQANRLISASAGNLRFRVEQDTGASVVGVIDTGSGTLMRRIPPDEMLAIAKALDRMQGLMVNLKV